MFIPQVGLLLGTLVWGADVSQVAEPFLANAEATPYWTPNNCCGVVAAYMVCHDLKRPLSLDALARQLPVSVEGTSMDAMADCFRAQGLATRGVRISASSLYQVMQAEPRLRAVISIKKHHWVTLRSAEHRQFTLFDYPNWSAISVDELVDQFDEVALLVAPTESLLASIDDSAAKPKASRQMLVAIGCLLLCTGACAAFVGRTPQWHA